MAKNVLTDNFSEPLNRITTAKVDIDPGDGNLTVDGLTGGEQVLASGTLQYQEGKGLPTRTLDLSNGEAALTLRGGKGGQRWFRFPWSACNGATEWQIHLNPAVASGITAHTDGGAVNLNLAGLAVARASAETGGGNVEVVLPGNATNLSVTAKTGAGNVVVYVPSGVAARIHATSGLGTVTVDPRFSKVDKGTYQSPDFDAAAYRVEITAKTGAGVVSVSIKESSEPTPAGTAGRASS